MKRLALAVVVLMAVFFFYVLVAILNKPSLVGRPERISWNRCSFPSRIVLGTYDGALGGLIKLKSEVSEKDVLDFPNFPRDFFLMHRRDFSRTDAGLQINMIKERAGENSLGTVKRDDYQGFKVYEQSRGGSVKYYVKEEVPKTLIVFPPDSVRNMRVFRQVPPDMEIDYVASKSDLLRLEKIHQIINSFINSHCDLKRDPE